MSFPMRIAMFRQPRLNVFVLQVTMRCLRSIGDNQEDGQIYLSTDNLQNLNDELQQNFRLNPGEFQKLKIDRTLYEVRVLKRKSITLTRVRHLYEAKKRLSSIKKWHSCSKTYLRKPSRKEWSMSVKLAQNCGSQGANWERLKKRFPSRALRPCCSKFVRYSSYGVSPLTKTMPELAAFPGNSGHEMSPRSMAR